MLSTKMPKILIVGSGLTGSLVAASLRQNAIDKQIQLSIWDKAKGSGGRMSTSRSGQNSHCTADLGAQYITCTPHYAQEHHKYYEELLAAGVLEPLKVKITNSHDYESGTKHFVAPKGMSSVVKHFISKSECQPEFDRHIADISRTDQNQWSVSTKCGKTDSFDVVVLTIPTPQLFLLTGKVPEILEKNNDLKKKLENVQYSSRYAVGLFFEPGTKLDLPFDVSYLKDDPVFRYIAVDNARRNRPELPTSVVLHTSVPFGVQHVDKTVAEATPILEKALNNSFPNLPKPVSTKFHKWRYSQVTEWFEGKPGVIELSRDPLLLIGGDALTHSNFDGCVSSAERVVHQLKMAAKL